MPLQMRLSQGDSRLYSPDRDLAYCASDLLLRAVRGLDPGNQEPWVRDYLAQNNVTPDMLCDAAVALGAYMKTVMDPAYTLPYDALQAAGFFDLPQPVQNIVCAKLGQILLSVFFPAVRDVSSGPQTPPFDMRAVIAAVDAVTSKKNLPLYKRLFRRWF